MSKHIVSGAIALMIVVLPLSTSALSQSDSYRLPTIPQNATIQELLNIVSQLQSLLNILLASQPTPPIMTDPLNCPIYNAPLCATNEHLVAGEYQPNGCQAGPRCVSNSPADTPTPSVSFIGISGGIYRMGDTVDWMVNYTNAPSDSNICLVIQSVTSPWEGGFQGFGGSDGCYYANGNGTRTFRATLNTRLGFDFRAGEYRLVAKLIKSATGNFSPYAVGTTGSFTVLPPIGEYPGDITVKLTGPANGSVYRVGDTIPVTYSYTGAYPNTQIIIKTENIQASNPPSGNVSGGQWQSPALTAQAGTGTYTWQTGPSMTDFTGTYKITAWMRECDPRGCSWNADFPGSPYPVRTIVSAPSPITLTLNSAVTGSPSGGLSIVQSESPVGQTISAGSDAIVANYFVSATAEDVRMTVGHFSYTDNITNDPTSCSLYDGATRVSSVTYPIYTANGSTGNYAFSFTPGIVIPRGTTKTLSMHCLIAAVTTPGSFKWGLPANAYFAAQGVQSGSVISVRVTEHPGNTMTVAGSTQGGNPRVLLGAATASNVSADYIDMPANTQFVLINQSTGARVESTSGYSQNGGSGSITIPFSDSMAAGSYYIKAQNYSTQAYIAQTVAFNYAGAHAATPSIRFTSAVRPFIRFHVDNMPAGVQGAFLAYAPTGTNVAYTMTITSSGDGTIVMDSASPSGQYYVKLLSNVNGVIAQSANMFIGTDEPSCVAPTITIPAAGYSLIISQPGQGQAIQTTGGPVLSITSLPWATLNGSIITFNSLPVAGTYPITITASHPCGNVTRTFNVIVERRIVACPQYMAPVCPAGQRLVIDPFTYDSNQCEVPHSHCVVDTPTTGTCTYTQGSSKLGDKDSKSVPPSTISISGGQAACSSWCSSQGAEAYAYYTCAYNGSPITMIKRDKQLASALTAVENAIRAFMSFFASKSAPVPDSVASTSSAPAQVQPTRESAPVQAPVQAAPTTGTLHAVYRDVAFPDIANVSKELAQMLCRADAVCTWNGEPIQAVTSFGQPGDPVLTVTVPAAGSKQTLASGAGYTFELTDTSLTSGAVPADTHRLYFAKYTSKNGPDVIYQAQITSVQRTIAGAVKLTWSGKILNADGSTMNLPAGFYYVGAVNGTNALKGGSTGSITVTP